jgi:hypothetical protein
MTRKVKNLEKDKWDIHKETGNEGKDKQQGKR